MIHLKYQFIKNIISHYTSAQMTSLYDKAEGSSERDGVRYIVANLVCVWLSGSRGVSFPLLPSVLCDVLL